MFTDTSHEHVEPTEIRHYVMPVDYVIRGVQISEIPQVVTDLQDKRKEFRVASDPGNPYAVMFEVSHDVLLYDLEVVYADAPSQPIRTTSGEDLQDALNAADRFALRRDVLSSKVVAYVEKCHKSFVVYIAKK